MEKNNMKIAIASEGNNSDSVVCPTAGRAPYFLIFENDELIETIKNPFAKGSGGAGFSVAYMLAEKNVNLIIAGKFGEKMTSALDDKGLNYKEVQNKTIKQILEEL